MRYKYTMDYYSVLKRNNIVPFAEAWMDQRLPYEVKQVRKEKTNVASNCSHVESRKMVQMNLFAKQK